MSEYGNLGAGFYLTLAYVVSAAVFVVYALVIGRRRHQAIEALKEEGFLEDKGSLGGEK